MKRLFSFLFLLCLGSTMVCFGQADSTVNVTYTFGDSFMDFVKNNYIAVVGFLAWMIFEHWLGKTDKVKPGSTLEAILNFLKAIVNLTLKKK